MVKAKISGTVMSGKHPYTTPEEVKVSCPPNIVKSTKSGTNGHYELDFNVPASYNEPVKCKLITQNGETDVNLKAPDYSAKVDVSAEEA